MIKPPAKFAACTNSMFTEAFNVIPNTTSPPIDFNTGWFVYLPSRKVAWSCIRC